jgi:glutamate-1-semialdehyde 2,1-aminomutase
MTASTTIKQTLRKRTTSSQKNDYLERYLSKTPASHAMYRKARRFLAGGQSHNARFFNPYPFYAARAQGRYIWDVDNNRYVDYWMGHTALIFGHSPKIVSNELRKQIDNGLLFGTPNKFAVELGELVTNCVACAESVRFCTTGAEATMYAARLARAYTKRKIIVKIAGGWHGYNSTLAIGVTFPYEISESAGLLPEDERIVRLVKFNDIAGTSKVLSESTPDVAAVIIEPVMGAGGVIPAERDYLKSLREQCSKIGALLIFDEIITGFRLALEGAQEFYGIKPDLCTLGKILSGGLPVSAVAGRREVISLADTTLERAKQERCWIGGGTFSEHALSMRAGIATLKQLKVAKRSIYGSIGNLGYQLRKEVDRAFSECGIQTKTTGEGSLFSTHFLGEDQEDIKSPEDVVNSDEKAMKEYYFSLIAGYGIFFIPGHIGAISTAHTKNDVINFVKKTEDYANNLAKTRKSFSS